MIDDKALNSDPYFYENPSGNPFIKNVDSELMGGGVIPVVKKLHQIVTFEYDSVALLYKNVKLHHGIGRICNCLMRARQPGTQAWFTIPQNLSTASGETGLRFYIYDITKNYIELSCDFFPTPKTDYEVEIFFLEFPLNVKDS